MSAASGGAREARGVGAPALALLLGSLASLLPAWARVPILLYDPVARSFRIAPIGAPGGSSIEMSFYGIYLCAALGGVLGAVLGFSLERRGTLRHGLLQAWALSALGLAAAYQLWSLLL